MQLPTLNLQVILTHWEHLDFWGVFLVRIDSIRLFLLVQHLGKISQGPLKKLSPSHNQKKNALSYSPLAEMHGN